MIGLLTRYILTAAIKDRIFILFFVLAVVAVCFSIFIGSSAVTEKDQFSIVFLASSLRIGGLLTLVLFVVFYLRRAFESRDVEFILARPVSRLQFLLAHSLAFSFLSICVALIALLVLILVPSAGADYTGYITWTVSIAFELILVTNVALFFAIILNNATAASLACLAFYVLGRMIGSILGIVHAEVSTGAVSALAKKAMLLISIIIPRLDLMGQSSWLVYGVDSFSVLGFYVVQFVVFYGLVMSAAYVDLKRRQF